MVYVLPFVTIFIYSFSFQVSHIKNGYFVLTFFVTLAAHIYIQFKRNARMLHFAVRAMFVGGNACCMPRAPWNSASHKSQSIIYGPSSGSKVNALPRTAGHGLYVVQKLWKLTLIIIENR